tara:strand:+ start:301 stop:480 length:180 start_codon:yes stop_codon:yes gene_type:complete
MKELPRFVDHRGNIRFRRSSKDFIRTVKSEGSPIVELRKDGFSVKFKMNEPFPNLNEYP